MKGMIGVVEKGEEGLILTVFAVRTRNPVAVVTGSASYVAAALVAIGLASPVAPLAKHRDRAQLALVRREPANGSA